MDVTSFMKIVTTILTILQYIVDRLPDVIDSKVN